MMIYSELAVDLFFFYSDMIAIPNFLFGAMENWGLITYRDWNLLFKPNVSSSANKQRVAEVVSHELAHQVAREISVPYYILFFSLKNNLRTVGFDSSSR